MLILWRAMETPHRSLTHAALFTLLFILAGVALGTFEDEGGDVARAGLRRSGYEFAIQRINSLAFFSESLKTNLYSNVCGFVR